MGFIYEQRLSDSPYVETITNGHTAGNGTVIRPAETHWHMVFVREQGNARAVVAGPLSTAGVVTFQKGAEILWIKFKLGTWLPHLPIQEFLDVEQILPDATRQSFWLKGSVWQFPTFDNAEVFTDRLVRNDLLACDPVVDAVLQGQPPDLSARTVRHRFLQATGLTQNHIYQFERAQRAADLLRQGVAILDTVFEVGYYDQPHLTRSLKQFIGHTPAQIIRMHQPE